VAHIFVLALAAAVYPTLLAGVIIMLTRPSPAGQLTAFLAGGMILSVTAGLLILAALEGSGGLDSSSQPASPAASIFLGLVSLAVAAAVATGRPRRVAERRASRPAEPAAPSRTKRALGSGSLPLTIALGAALNLPGIWYLAALADISAGGYSTATDVVLVLAFNVIMFALVELPLLAYVLSPERARAAVDGFNVWLRGNKRGVAVGVATAVGIYLIVKGIIDAT
jgi:hypothetical protein